MAGEKQEPSPIEVAVVKAELETKMAQTVTKDTPKEDKFTAIELHVIEIYSKWSDQKRQPIISCVFNKDGTYKLDVK